MLDVFDFSQLAGPSAVRKLAGRVGWVPVLIYVEGDFFIPLLYLRVITRHEPKRRKGLNEGVKGFLHGHVRRPVRKGTSNGPPPSLGVSRRPRNAIVFRSRRARDCIQRMAELGKNGF